MSLPDFEKLLKETAGLDAASLGVAALERAVRERTATCALPNADAYWERICSSELEREELLEALVVPETWFFRDREVFATLASLAVEKGWPFQPQNTWRLLSLPCSSGEEPYSMAMALLDAGLPEDRFSIDAVDLSRRAIIRAQEAVYGKNSFRTKDLGFRDRYFEVTACGHRIVEAVRRQVHFQRGNILDEGLLPGSERYDVIFCRNLLIYFDRSTQERVIGVLERLLAAGGTLFIGSAETSLLSRQKFSSIKAPMSFAFRKGQSARHGVKEVSAPLPNLPEPPVKHGSFPDPETIRPLSPDEMLDGAVLLADQGRLADAAKRCEDFLRTNTPSAKAYHLLGLVRDAGGRTAEAADFYRKALYLEPDHHGALLHLALLLEKRGEAAEAKILHQRRRRREKAGSS